MTQPASTDLDAQLDEILAWYFAKMVTEVKSDKDQFELDQEFRNRLSKLIADREREARIDEIRVVLVKYGSRLPEDIVDDLRSYKIDLERQKAGDAQAAQ